MGMLCVAVSLRAQSFGGGALTNHSQSECIPAEQRTHVAAKVEAFALGNRIATAAAESFPQQYPFQPLAGTVWDDRFILNFYDVDPSPGILEFACSDWTYDTHYATDILIRGFGEQDRGVPVFAALNGTVADAHDGEGDRNTVPASGANYVILHHGGGHYSWYWHLRKGSVAVSVGQQVRAGEQIGQIGSSGHSFSPHLHFESRIDGYAYDTYTGPCHPGPQHWVNQPVIPRHTWISQFAMHNTNDIPPERFYPHDPPRGGTFIRNGRPQPIGAWYVIHNEPANCKWRARYLRPNGSVGYDSGTRRLNTAENRFAARWFAFEFDPDSSGSWSLELSVDDEVLMTMPFVVLDSGSLAINRSPLRPAAITFDPISPTTNDAIFCRLTIPPLQDPDYDLVSYAFHWFINGVSYRHVTNAAFADAIPRGVVFPGDSLRCVVTPYDGQQFGSSIEGIIPGTGRLALSIVFKNSQVVVSWPTSVLSYALQVASDADAWSNEFRKPFPSGDRLFVTNSVQGSARFFRLKSP